MPFVGIVLQPQFHNLDPCPPVNGPEQAHGLGGSVFIHVKTATCLAHWSSILPRNTSALSA